MPALELATAVQVRLFWTLNGVAAFNVLGGIVAGGFTNSQAHADSLSTAVLGSYTSSGLKALQASTTELLGAGIRDVRLPNLPEFSNTGSPVAGTGAGDPMPNTLAAVVTLRTAKAGKSYRGRVFIGGANEAQNDATGHIAGAYNTALAAFITAVKANMLTEGITLAVLSRPRFSSAIPPVMVYGGDITPVTAQVTRDTLWDTMRSRKQ